MATKKFSPAQIAAQQLFAERARAGTLGKGKRKANPAKKYRFNVTSKTSPRYVAGFFSTKEAAEDYRSSLNSPFNFTITKKEIDPDVVVRKTKATIEYDIYGVPSVKRKPNPDKSKPRAYVKRASQITGAPPSKRLVTRRKMALKAPAGYFPNPSTNRGLAIFLDAVALGETFSESKLIEALDHPSLSVSDRNVIRDALKGLPYSHIRLQDAAMKIRNYKGERKTNPTAPMMTGYQVICMHPKKHVVGIFKTMAEAKLVARAMADAKGVPYAVKTVKVHKAHFAV